MNTQPKTKLLWESGGAAFLMSSAMGITLLCSYVREGATVARLPDPVVAVQTAHRDADVDIATPVVKRVLLSNIGGEFAD